ncbi:hypothetical protein [Polynucleobacter sp. UK-Kesae-W10]|uniref:hypothetical protein n=1 Tax=Polynucleobacter sp. UK-Kesae-W10 TaxID=1819738 RepID=UPI001C0E40D8|nr:hypothetical protein [Polynucleobacter sp. UK-Kesae-W10]MBU3577664.1 hypothetical protein [Polynucleobacter sp. UK-Kesae-W10]
MSQHSFFGRHPVITLLAIALLICGSAAIAGTQIQSGVAYEAAANPSNPHRIPAHLDPKSQELSDEINAIKVELREELAEVSETVHSVAFKDHHGTSQQTIDFTTGTSN